jgi:hypothetical protein
VIVGLGAILSGCGGGVCTGWNAIYVSDRDILTPETSDQILAINEYGYKLNCPGFTPTNNRRKK